MTPAALLKALEGARDIPSLPQAVGEVQAAIGREDASLDELAEAVGRDQGLAARALRVANSSLYGVQGRVSSIRQAMNILGLRTVSTFLTAAAVSERFKHVRCAQFDLPRYWRHSIGVALCAKDIARRRRLDLDAAFTAGLLHDLGRLLLASQAPEAYAAAHQRQSETDCPMIDAERATLGSDHTLLGADIATRWHFGAPIVEAIRLHHTPPSSNALSIAEVVHVADNIVHALDVANDPNEMVPTMDSSAWNRVALSQGEILLVFSSTEQELDDACAALAV